MMSDEYEEAFAATDDQNITYIQYIQHNEGEADQINFQIIPNHAIFKPEESALCEDMLSEDNTCEVLESVVNIGKKATPIKREETVEKKLVQITDANKAKGRKRVIADQTRAIRKMRANTNKPYVNAKGKEVMPKEFDENFECFCHKKCTEKLSMKTRRQIFKMFWGSYLENTF